MTDKYILDGHEPVPVDLMTWARWFEDNRDKRRVAATDIFPGKLWVSTVFLGIDHGFGMGPPLLFETMVFDESGNDDDCERYTTWEEAEAGHAKIVARLANRAA